MKIKSSLLSAIALLSPCVLSAGLPPDETVQHIRTRMEVLKINPDSNGDLDALFQEIETVTEKYGIEGVAWVAYQEPVLMEAFISPQSLGLENMAVSLLSQAVSREQLVDMINALVLAQLFIKMDPEAPEHMAYYVQGAGKSSVTLSDGEIEQLVVQAVVAGIESVEQEVQAAHANHANAIQALEKVKGKLIAKGKYWVIPVIDRIISKLKNHPANPSDG